jgi:hypothetical protein
MRNAAPPTVVVTGVVAGYLLGGAVLIETVFNLNGIGQYAVQSITTADYAPIHGFVLVAAVFTIMVYPNLASDLVVGRRRDADAAGQISVAWFLRAADEHVLVADRQGARCHRAWMVSDKSDRA